MEKSLEELGFVQSVGRFADEVKARHDIQRDPVRFGIKFLDKALYGLTRHDLMLIGAKTGVGKTELINTIAVMNAQAGKKVFLFALEAEPFEMERRIRFRELMKALRRANIPEPNYREWLWGKGTDVVKEFEKNLEPAEYLANLHTFYRKRDFGIKDFERIFAAIENQADLIIVDHIHFFDLETENENRELGEITKRIRDLVLISGVPVILVGHLRKSSEFSKRMLPDIESFHGSSNLPKQITKGIILESGGPTRDGKFATFIRVVKDRSFGAATRYVGKVLFDPSVNEYTDDYTVHVLTNQDTKLEDLEREDYPKWLKY
jgi:nucleoside-triphosphatase THEP1